MKPPSLHYPISKSFILALNAEGRSQRTQVIYADALRQLELTGVHPGQATTEQLREFFSAMRLRGNQEATISQRYRALRRFYKWLIKEGDRQDNPLDRIGAPRVHETEKPHYDQDDLMKVLGAIRKKRLLDLRDDAMITLLADTGLRAFELCNAQQVDLDRDEMSLLVTGKGGDERRVGLGGITAVKLDRYLRRRKDHSGHLFVTDDGEKLTVHTLYRAVERRFRAVGVPFSGLHAFRRSFAIAYLSLGASTDSLQTLAGWKSTAMLRKYTRATQQQRALQAHRQFSPADNLLGKAL